MTSKKVTSIILICVFVMRTSSVVKMPVLSLHALPFDFRNILKALCFVFMDNFWPNAVRQFHTQVGTHQRAAGFICMLKVLETSVTKLDSWPSHKIRLLFGLSKFSSRITLGIRKEVWTRFNPVWTFSSDVCSSDDHLPSIPHGVNPVSTIFAHRNAWFRHRFCTFFFSESTSHF